MIRYSVIPEKNPREIVLLRGRGCAYRQCSFCDYHLDASPDEEENYALNQRALSKVTGRYGRLEVINSGSVFELDQQTLDGLQKLCQHRHIHTLHFESHYGYRARITSLRSRFAPVTLKMKLGLETFDAPFREKILRKGIPDSDPAEIAREFDAANFLFGLRGQSEESMERDIRLGLQFFERICVNLMCPNTTPIQPDPQAAACFREKILPRYRDNPRVDILCENTDFGVGGVDDAE